MLQLHKIDEGREYAEFMHLPRKKFTDFGKFTDSLNGYIISNLNVYVSNDLSVALFMTKLVK